MLSMYTAQFMASKAQRRHFDGVRLDGPITDKPSRLRSMLSALFARSAPTTDRARTGLSRVAAA